MLNSRQFIRDKLQGVILIGTKQEIKISKIIGTQTII